MRILPRAPRSTRADGANSSDAIPTPRRAPTWPRETAVNEHPFWAPIADEIPEGLPPEERNLLTAYPDAPAPGPGPRRILAALAMASAAHRSACRILAVSLAQNLNEADLEFVIAQNLALFATSVNS